MNLRSLLAIIVLTAALPALAAPTCNAPQVVSGNNCTLSAALGWGVAGLGTASIITIYVPPNASGPVDIEVTGMSSNMGSTYAGYFGLHSRCQRARRTFVSAVMFCERPVIKHHV